jgi:hypothetical protein
MMTVLHGEGLVEQSFSFDNHVKEVADKLTQCIELFFFPSELMCINCI